jgi:flagellar protein FlbD
MHDIYKESQMIEVTRFNGSKLFINPDHIKILESTPDTVITLTENIKIVVKDDPKSVIERFIAYQQLVHNPQLHLVKKEIG